MHHKVSGLGQTFVSKQHKTIISTISVLPWGVLFLMPWPLEVLQHQFQEYQKLFKSKKNDLEFNCKQPILLMPLRITLLQDLKGKLQNGEIMSSQTFFYRRFKVMMGKEGCSVCVLSNPGNTKITVQGEKTTWGLFYKLFYYGMWCWKEVEVWKSFLHTSKSFYLCLF